MKISRIGNTTLGANFPYLILEAGVNHEGSLERAFEMVDAAAELGAPMIKFQSYKAESLASRQSPAYWDRSEEKTDSQYALFQKFDKLNVCDYVALAQRCQSQGIEFCSTAFDAEFVDALAPYMSLFKVASADLTNVPLLRQIAEKGKPVVLSTGASELSEIHDAVSILEGGGVEEVALLHCVLEYPTRPENANLLSIKVLQREFPNHTIGWSDHVKVAHGGASVIAAWGLGAEIIEKHFTLDKSLPGNDHYHALDVADVASLMAQLKYMSQLWGTEEKKSLPCESEARVQARRSLVAQHAIEKGTFLTEKMFVPKRPGTGISPDSIDQIVGQVATQQIECDAQLEWEMIAPAEEIENALEHRVDCLVA